MSTRPPTPLSTWAASFGAAFVFVTTTTQAASDAELLRCRAVTEPAARLACYDALPPSAAAGMPPATAQMPTPAPAAVLPAAPGFGFELRAIQTAPEVQDSRISGLFEGWRPGTRIRLDNGQVWQVIDDSRAVMDLRDPKVRISRAAMGSFFFEVEGRRSAARVRRVE